MINFFQIDSFTKVAFRGNPAGVCLLENPAETAWCANVAMEMNLSETAFVSPRDTPGSFDLRWFTPKIEVELCGHATLAAAHALWELGYVETEQAAEFHTLSGKLIASQQNDMIVLDFPSQPCSESESPDGLVETLGVAPQFVGRNKNDYLIQVSTVEDVQSAEPDFRALGQIDCRGVIITAHDEIGEFDFVSRFFAPAAGIDEDPVTGSAHTCLAPFWSDKLNRTEMTGFQASARGGIVSVRLDGDRVHLGGHAVTILRGRLAK